jgi:hypothetical protein
LRISPYGIQEGKLWFEGRYTEKRQNQLRMKGTNWPDLGESAGILVTPRFINRISLAAFDLKSGSWDVLQLPEPPVSENENANEFSQLTTDSLYLCGPGYLKRFDLGTKNWQNLSVPWEQTPKLFKSRDRLFAANDSAIFEIADHGESIKLLASCRRRPPMSALDSFDKFESPTVFEGPSGEVCACVGHEVFDWDGAIWSKLFDFHVFGVPRVFEGAVYFSSPLGLWLWSKTNSTPRLLVKTEQSRPTYIIKGPGQRWLPATNETPLSNFRGSETLLSSPQAFLKSNLCFFVASSLDTNFPGQPNYAARVGYHAKLVCLDPACPEPVALPLRFDENYGPPPTRGVQLKQVRGMPGSAWLRVSEDSLFIGQEHATGFWRIPLSLIESSVAEQKKTMVQSKASALAASSQTVGAMLAKYDHNHNGILDPQEKEEALADPAFIESQLDIIDANHNNRLDPEELGWFDANQNKRLDPNEQAGLAVAQHLLTARLLKEYDLDHDGTLDGTELGDLLQHPIRGPSSERKMGVGELETMLRRQFQNNLRSSFTRTGGSPLQIWPGEEDSPDFFKACVEQYWRGGRPDPNEAANAARRAFQRMQVHTNYPAGLESGKP